MRVDKTKIERDEVKIVAEQQQEKRTIVGSQVRYKGHIMFEINCTDGTIIPATFSSERAEIVEKRDINFGVFLGTATAIKRDVIVRENCLYIAALNKKSALKKYLAYITKNSKQL